jgi:hypothetical protein
MPGIHTPWSTLLCRCCTERKRSSHAHEHSHAQYATISRVTSHYPTTAVASGRKRAGQWPQTGRRATVPRARISFRPDTSMQFWHWTRMQARVHLCMVHVSCMRTRRVSMDGVHAISALPRPHGTAFFGPPAGASCSPSWCAYRPATLLALEDNQSSATR